jgi:anti-anti-sigma factor
MGGDLDITVRGERGAVIAAVTGEIDISTVTQLRERLFELADDGGMLIVDLNRVTFIDSAGLGRWSGRPGELPRTAAACMRSALSRSPGSCCG